jgi:predicted amidohydrolase
MSILRTLLVQADVQWNEPGSNRRRLGAMLQDFSGQFDLAVLPETFTTGFLGDQGRDDEGMDGPTVSWMQEQAERHGGAVAGSLVICEGSHRFNRFLFVTADGVQGHYDKRHLFSYGGEDEHYTPGAERVNIGYKGWRINLQVCYDLRFPAWCRNQGDYDLMLLVANWPARRIHHWSSLLEARAIENQAWVVGVNRSGKDGKGLEYPGCSVVHGPMGDAVVKLGDEETCSLVELNLEAVQSARGRFPFQSDADSYEFL